MKGLSGYEIDPEADAFGYWRCTVCNSTFFDGPRAIHKPSCTDFGMCKSFWDETYRNCVRVVNSDE